MPHCSQPLGLKGAAAFPTDAPYPKRLPFCLIVDVKLHKTCRRTERVQPHSGLDPTRPRATPCRPGPRGARTCTSAIFGSSLGKEEVLSQGFLSLETGAAEVTQRGLREQLSVFSLVKAFCACAEIPQGRRVLFRMSNPDILPVGPFAVRAVPCERSRGAWRRCCWGAAVQPRRPCF